MENHINVENSKAAFASNFYMMMIFYKKLGRHFPINTAQ